MFYRLSSDLPGWARQLITNVHEQIAGLGGYAKDLRKLRTMSDRPEARACG
jgi:hypothetical protein